MVENLLFAASIAQAIMVVLSFALMCIKPFRNWFLGIKERNRALEKYEATEHESVKCLLRSEIVRIYYANRDKKTLHSFEYENVAMLYNSYKAMGGNSFIDKIWEEVQLWTVTP